MKKVRNAKRKIQKILFSRFFAVISALGAGAVRDRGRAARGALPYLEVF